MFSSKILEKKFFFRKYRLLPVILLLLSLSSSLPALSSGAVLYVKENSPAPGDGMTWQTAFPDLQQALDIPGTSEIRVSQGTYKPSKTIHEADPRTATFSLRNGQTLYGGFRGTETFRNQRNWKEYPTVLEGDLGISGDISDNCYHVVTLNGANETVLLDGFVLTRGNADGTGELYRNGGGLAATGGSPAVRNCTFTDNHAVSCGGGVYANNSDILLESCTFLENSACNGGGFYSLHSAPRIEKSTFTSNTVQTNGGGIMTFTSFSRITNCTFWKNRALNGYGGGFHSFNDNPVICNVTFAENTAKSGGGGMSFYGGTSVVVNSISWGNAITSGAPEVREIFTQNVLSVISSCAIRGGFSESLNTVLSDPELGELGNNGGGTQTCALSGDSSARKAGLNPGEHLLLGKIISVPEEDQRGMPRPQHLGADIGSYQFVPTPTAVPTPTSVPTPTKIPTPTRVPEPVSPSPTSKPTVTSVPVASPFPTENPFPTQTPAPEAKSRKQTGGCATAFFPGIFLLALPLVLLTK
ncbi:MAG TPA: choice-of-anchor Q domain-containing protein [Synergistaceae bacterium]|nr:choice-of-anchor Q domain-containing protein [Synergistaceae bacterium]